MDKDFCMFRAFLRPFYLFFLDAYLVVINLLLSKTEIKKIKKIPIVIIFF